MLVVGGETKAGIGVFADRDYAPGETLAHLEGYTSSRRTRYTIEMAGRHIEPSNALRYINHSCDPNATFEGWALVARRPIKAGEQVCFDYQSTETALNQPFECQCGSADCRGWID